MKGFLYPNIRNRKTIEDVIVNMSEQDHERKFEKLLINTLDGEINVDVLSPGEIHE
jgi:rubrerythrin